MARQIGVVRYLGTLGNIRHFKIKGLEGDFAGLIGGVDKDTILNDPAFIRVRENMSEFGGSAKAGRAFRKSIAGLVRSHADPFMTGRLTGKLNRITKSGPGPRGERELLISTNKTQLTGFEFNRNLSFGSVFGAAFTVNANVSRNIATLNTAAFTPTDFIDIPAGATDFRMILAAVVLSDYRFDSIEGYVPKNPPVNGLAQIEYSSYFDVNLVAGPISLTAAIPGSPLLTADDTLICCVGIEFYQEVSGVYYLFAGGNATRLEALF